VLPAFARLEAIDDAAGAPVLSYDSPYKSAKEFVQRYCIVDGLSGMYFHGGEFWRWNGQFYEVYPKESLRANVYEFLDGSLKLIKTEEGFDKVAFRPKPAHVNAVLDCLESGLCLEARPPVWLEDGRKAGAVLVFQNGLVDAETGETWGLTNKLWVQGGLDYEFDEKAECPRWLQFLEEVQPGDEVAQRCIEETLGLCMTEDLRFEKGFLWVGVARSGKGTLAHLLRLLTGTTNFVSLSFHTWVKGEYSREKLIGKRAGVFTDVRFKPGKWYGQTWDPGGIDHVSQELLLKLTSGDPVTLGQKWKGDWEGKVPIKVILISNEVPNLQDRALITRFVVVEFKVSFLDREDIDLKRKLEGELPGIAARCLRAYRRLLERKRFVQPESGKGLAQKIKEKVNLYSAFIQERCVIDPEAAINCGALYNQFGEWCRETGHLDLLKSTAKNTFKGKLQVALGWDKLGTDKPKGKSRRYKGLRLKTLDEENAALWDEAE